MRVFDKPNLKNFTCPVCGTSDEHPVVLVAIEGNEEDNIVQAMQAHVRCINLWIIPDKQLIYMVF